MIISMQSFPMASLLLQNRLAVRIIKVWCPRGCNARQCVLRAHRNLKFLAHAVVIEEDQSEDTKKKKVIPPEVVYKSEAVNIPDQDWENAALLIDKEIGWTSNDVCQKIKGMLKVKKIGHAGTLDPLATGLLILGIGKGTKSIDSFQAQHKEYTGTIKLGESTPSYDSGTEVNESLGWEHITDEDLQEAARHFSGDQMQVPPMFSALKVNGKRLYKSAHAGIEVERQARPIHIFSLELSRVDPSSNNVEFRVSCSKGTYIRSLVHDLGKYMGSAAHMTSLRRESIGNHRVANAWKIDELNLAVNAVENV